MKRPVEIRVLAEHPGCNPICRVCHYKGLDYSAQIERKQGWAERCLGTWGAALRPIIPAPADERIGYRAKSWMRAHVDQGRVSFGMVRANRTEEGWGKEFISWDGCPLHLPAINELTQRIGRMLADQAPSFTAHSLVGIWIGTPHVVVVAREPDFEPIARLDWSGVLLPPFDRVWFHANPQVGRRIFSGSPIRLLAGPPVDSKHHPIRAFRQIAQSLLTEARRAAVNALMHEKPELILDLYCGTGDLALLLPRETGWIGIELAKEAVGYANTLRPGGDAKHEAFVGAVEQRLRDPRVVDRIIEPYALYINPPRSGLTEDAIQAVLDLIRSRHPLSIVYLSCSASSLARDLVDLESAGFRVQTLQPYDFFPQTEHFETLAVLEKAPMK